MALVFPLGPAIGQQFTGTNGIVYEWTSIGAWDKVNSVQTARSGPTASTSSARIPVGNTAERPAPTLVAGQFRYNNQIPQLEYSDGTTWLPVSGASLLPASLAEAQAGAITTKYSSPQTAVPKDASGMTGSAFLPAGNTAQRPLPTAYTGQFRYNSQIPQLEYSDGTTWLAVGGSILPATLAEAAAGIITTKYSSPETAVPKDASGMTGAAFLPAGTTAQRPVPTLYTGQFRYNNQIPQLEYSDGTTWLPVSGASLLPASLAEAQAGAITTKYSSPQTAVPKDASGMTGSAFLPAGTTAQRPLPTLYTGQFRYNTTIPQLEYSDGTTWLPSGGGGGIPTQTLVFTSSGSYTATRTATVWVFVAGGGGGGIGFDSSNPFGPTANGGGNGAASWGYFNLVNGTTYSFTVGAAGADGGVSVPSGRAGDGGTTSGFGMTVGGGQGGGDQSSGYTPSTGYSALAGSGGSLNNVSGYSNTGWASMFVPGIFGIGARLFNDVYNSYFINGSYSGCVVILFF